MHTMSFLTILYDEIVEGEFSGRMTEVDFTNHPSVRHIVDEGDYNRTFGFQNVNVEEVRNARKDLNPNKATS